MKESIDPVITRDGSRYKFVNCSVYDKRDDGFMGVFREYNETVLWYDATIREYSIDNSQFRRVHPPGLIATSLLLPLSRWNLRSFSLSLSFNEYFELLFTSWIRDTARYFARERCKIYFRRNAAPRESFPPGRMNSPITPETKGPSNRSNARMNLFQSIHPSAPFNSARRAFYSGKSFTSAFTAYFRQPARKVRADECDEELESG